MKQLQLNRILKALIFILVVIVFVVLLVRNQENTAFLDTTSIFEKHFTPFLSATQDSTPVAHSKAFTAYQQGKYEEAINGFEHYHEQHPEATEAIFYKGISQLAVGKMNEGAGSFLRYKNLGGTNIEVDWYLALAYIYQKDLDAAAVVLRSYMEGGTGQNEKKARKILVQIRE